MENLKSTTNLLKSVMYTMDTVSVVGLDNQDKFIGCAQAIRRATEMVNKYISDNEKKEEKADG
ncbi:MAG TPA: hypothetical protein DFH97_00810 [Clostridiales bacterium]|nr:hypothetical protein [Clostridiales bacterium]HCI63591.1 hypothetical protein [Clostridiales bacterium]